MDTGSGRHLMEEVGFPPADVGKVVLGRAAGEKTHMGKDRPPRRRWAGSGVTRRKRGKGLWGPCATIKS